MFAVTTLDIDEAESELRRTFPEVHVSLGLSRRPFRMRHSRLDVGGISRARLAIDGDLVTTGIYPDHVAIGRRRRGSVDIRYGGDRVDTGGPYLRPPGESQARFTDSDVELLILDRVDVEAVAARFLAGTGRRLIPISCAVSSPTSIAASRMWSAAAAAVADSLDQPATRHSRDAVLELAVSSLLTCYPLTLEFETSNGEGYLPRAVTRAARFMDDHLTEPVTVLMVADAARMSVRGLQSAFRRELGLTPLEYLRDARLRSARADLERLDPSATTVAQIARRWGFDHPARFAALYRSRYGCNPSETLRQ